MDVTPTRPANRAFGLAHSWDGQLRPNRASMAAAVLEPLDGRPEVPFDLIIEVEEEPAPPIREDPADLCGVGDTGGRTATWLAIGYHDIYQ